MNKFATFYTAAPMMLIAQMQSVQINQAITLQTPTNDSQMSPYVRPHIIKNTMGVG
jgi:hypothetical protein